MTAYSIRPITLADLDSVVQLERDAHLIWDKDFGIFVEDTSRSWNRDDWQEVITEYKHNRALLVEWELGLVGLFVYDIKPREYVLFKLTVCPAHNLQSVWHKVCEFLSYKLYCSEKRERLVVLVRDGDWEQIRYWQEKGMSVNLLPNYYGDSDGWTCSLERSVVVKPECTRRRLAG